MTISSLSNSTLVANQATYQQPGNINEQMEKRRAGLSSENNSAGNTFSDSVNIRESVGALSSEKTAAPGAELDSSSAGNLLQQVMKAIKADSKAAVSAQANQRPQAAQTLLTD